MPNLLKYLYDIDPTRPMNSNDRGALPVVGITPGGAYLTLTYRQNALFDSASVHVAVQVSNDLVTWTTDSAQADQPTPTGQTDSSTPNNDPLMQVRVPITGAKQFVRLQVTSP